MDDKLTKQQDANKSKIFFALMLISILYFTFAVSHMNVRVLNVDDMAQIHFTRPGLSSAEMWTRYQELQGDTYPPLLFVITSIWLKIAPFGAGWLKILSIIMVSLGVFISGLCGLELRNPFAGIICAILAATSNTLLMESTFSFRAYGLMFLTMCLVLYTFILRNNNYLNDKNTERKSRKYFYFYSGAMLLAAYTHYFAVLFCGMLFVFDFIWILKKKLHWEALLSYIITGIVYLPWLIFGVLPAVGKYTQGFWPAPPTLNSLKDLYIFLAGGSQAMATFATIAFLVLMVDLFEKKLRNVPTCFFTYGTLLLTSLIIVLMVYLYSTNFPSSIFANRYFIILIPTFVVFMGIGVASIGDYLYKAIKCPEVYPGLCVFMTAFLVFYNLSFLYRQQEPYLDVAVWLRQQDIFMREDTLLLTTYVNEDGLNYFLTENWTISCPEARSIRELMAEPTLIENFNQVYVVEDFAGKSQFVEDLLNANYELTLERPDYHLKVYYKN